MSKNQFSATSSLTGYLYQCRYALYESLKRLKMGEDFIASLETLDDVTFDTEGEAHDILQTKHHIKDTANLTDASPDLWKTLRIWCDLFNKDAITSESTFYLITTASSKEGSIASFLGIEDRRNIEKAKNSLNITAKTSTNEDNQKAYKTYNSLDDSQKKELLKKIYILDSTPSINQIGNKIKEEVYHAVKFEYLDSFVDRLEGWWFRMIIKHLGEEKAPKILSEELRAEINKLREQFKEDNLPIDDDLIMASVDASGYEGKTFVDQLKLIDIGNERILMAIRNYFRAFEQRSRWVREDLLITGDLERYEEKLKEEWKYRFEQMRDELGDEKADKQKKKLAKKLYKWVETGDHPLIKPRCTESFVSRGSLQILSDNKQIGWHPDFRDRLEQVLLEEEANE